MRFFMIFAFLFPLVMVAAQDQPPHEGWLKYDPDFSFKEGIYANFEMVKANSPIPKTRIVTDIDFFDSDFYDKLTQLKKISFYDDNGVLQEIGTQNLWGYGRNGILYIHIAQGYHRISYFGSISHLVATITIYNNPNYEPYYYYNSYNAYRYMGSPSSYTTTEVRQYLLDFSTGDVLDYTVESVEILLMKDPELHDEFAALRNRQKKQMKFVYIRKFNERHPLWFPPA
ncbi:MAG: hypothetical protein ACOYXB_09930 [Bacteroidota bacterium]